MKTVSEPMEWLDRYLAEIGRMLPRRQREDITAEIRSSLTDSLEDRARTEERPLDEEMVLDELVRFGPPRSVVDSYLPQKALIGPQLLPFFWMITRIVLIVLIAVSLAGWIISGYQGSLTAEQLRDGLLGLLSGAMQAFGNIVLVFIILERFLPKSEFEKERSDWNPRSLEPVIDEDRLSIPGLMVEIGFTIAALIFFNLYSSKIGLYIFSDGTVKFIPVVTDAFYRLLPWFSLRWIADIAFKAVLIRQKRWNSTTRWISIALNVFDAALLLVLIFGTPVFSLSAQAFTAPEMGFSQELQHTFVDILLPMLGTILRGALGIALVVESVEMAGQILKQLGVRLSFREPD